MMSQINEEFYKPMLDILARKPNTLTLRLLSFVLDRDKYSYIPELEGAINFYHNCYESGRYDKNTFNIFARNTSIGVESIIELRYEGKIIITNQAQKTFFMEMIRSRHLEKIQALKSKIEEDMYDASLKQKRIRNKKLDLSLQSELKKSAIEMQLRPNGALYHEAKREFESFNK